MDDNAGKIASQIARRKDPPRHIQILRMQAKFVLGACAFLYLIGTDSVKGKAFIGFCVVLVLFGISYLIPRDREDSDLEA